MRIVYFILTTALLSLSGNVFSAMDHSSMAGMESSSQNAQTWNTTGVIKSWSPTSVSISHRPVAQLNWPAMTMSFELDGYQGKPFTPGQQIHFTFRQTESGYALVSASAQ
ncbi:copper-binding protein [Enterobacteriaceae bacterium BIT-l23]|uniref:copper-binding protein n=1 Tax=Jejubacter sp. L23 TaxID=3092086 RepID=UPI001584C453|nr:copper-binding protein [Enterobacteriaceae bacterium BIT-l23]